MLSFSLALLFKLPHPTFQSIVAVPLEDGLISYLLKSEFIDLSSDKLHQVINSSKGKAYWHCFDSKQFNAC